MNKPPSDKKGNKPVVRAKRTSRAPSDDPVEERLSSIYRDEQGDLPDFDQLDRKRSFWWLRTTVWVVIIACVVSVSAWVGFLVWRPWRSDGPPAIALRIEASTALAPGKEEEIRIQWENTGMRPIQAAEVRVFLPTDFVLQQATPQPTSVSSSLWSLGLLPPQQKGSIVLRGIFYGSADRQATIQALATYRHGSVERERQLAETLRLAYVTSTVEGLLVVPERMLPGDQAVLRYQVTNRSDQVLGPLTARFNLPEGFIVSASSSPGLNQTGQLLTFPITRLPPGSMTTLQVVGSMLSGHAGDAVLTAAVGRIDPRGAFVALSASEKRSVILAGDLGLRLIVNGSPTETTIDADTPLRVTLAYENTSGEVLKDVSLSLVAESFVNGKRQTGTSGLIAWSDLQDLQRAATNTKGVTQTLKLSATQVPSFVSLPAGAKGSFDWILPIRLAPTGTKDGVIQLAALAHIDRVGETSGSRDVRLTPLALRYKSDADIRVFARYSTEEGAPIGTGPLPPQVGKTTDYRIVWQLTKRVHELGEVVVRAKLPAIAVWTKSVQVDKGTLTYDEKTREVHWTIPNVPLASGNVIASFGLQVTPERADVGRFAPLVGEVTFEARDLQLNTPLSRLKPALTTDLPDDEVARGRGVVR